MGVNIWSTLGTSVSPGHFLADVGVRAVGSITGIVAASLTRVVQQNWNKHSKTVYPDPQSLFLCNFKGVIDKQTLRQRLFRHAIDLPVFEGNQGDQWQDAWRDVYLAMKPVPAPDVLRRLRARKFITERTYRILLRRNGMPEPWQREAWIEHLSAMLSPPSYVELWRRGEITIDERDQKLEESGYSDDKEASNIVALSYNIPNVGTQQTFAHWNVFDFDFVRRWQLDHDKPGWWDERMVSLGLDGDAQVKSQQVPGRKGITQGQAIWISHWSTPSTGEAANWRNRFRGDPAKPQTWSVPGVSPFTDDDFDKVLQLNQIIPRFRTYVKEASRPLLSIRHIRMLLAYEVVDKAWVTEWAKSLGYKDEDAEKLATANYESVLAKRLDPLKTDARSTILKGYAAGWLSRDNAAGLLYPLILTRPSDVIAFRAKSVDDQNRIGSASTVVSTALLQVDLEQKGVNLREWIRSIRGLYVRGQIDASTASTRLRQLGMVADRIPDIVDRWNAARAGATREVSVSQLKRMVERGIVPLSDYQYRLLQLNYSLPDVVRLTAEIGYDAQQSNLKQQAALARLQGQQQKAAVAQVKAARAAHRQAISDLARSGSPSKLVDWAVRGILDERTFKRRMRSLDWPHDDIENLWAEVLQRIASKPKKQPKPPKPERVPKAEGPTISTLERWFAHGILTEIELRTRLSGLGWKASDIDKEVQDTLAKQQAKKTTPRPPKPPAKVQPKPKELTKAELLKMFDDGVLGQQGLTDGLKELGYTDEDIQSIIIEELVKLGVALPGQ